MKRFDLQTVADYDTRHRQTISNAVGFTLFVSCWIATPLWQWFGIDVVFHNNNLKSVSRDVGQLVEDNE